MDGSGISAVRPLAQALPAIGDPERCGRLAGLALAVAERFALGTECTTAAPAARGWDIELVIGTARIRLRVDEPGMAWAAPRFLGLDGDYPLDPPLLAALFEAGLADNFAELERLLDAPLRVERLSAAASEPDGPPPDLAVVLTDGGVRLPLWIWAADAGRLPAVPPRFPAAARLPLGFRVSVGGRGVALGRLRAAAPGDIVVTEQPYTDARQPVTLWLGREVALGGHLMDEDTIMVEQRVRHRSPPEGALEAEAAAQPEAAQPEAAQTETAGLRTATDAPEGATVEPAPERLLSPRDLESLPVHVEVDVGAVELTVRELRELAPGTVLPFGRPIEAPAVLTVNGCRIGTADLVDVNGRLGARILTLVR